MPGLRGSFKSAFLALLLAIGLPFIVFTFGAIRHRQLQSKANPRWAQFAKVTGPQVPNSSLASSVRPVSVRTANGIPDRTDGITTDACETEPTRHSIPEMNLTGSITGHSSIEIPVRSLPTDKANFRHTDAVPESSSMTSPPIVFRPVDEEAESHASDSTRRLELQLQSVRHRLDQIAEQNREQQEEDSFRQAQLSEREKELAETLKKIRETSQDLVIVVPVPTDASFVSHNSSGTVRTVETKRNEAHSDSETVQEVSSPLPGIDRKSVVAMNPSIEEWGEDPVDHQETSKAKRPADSEPEQSIAKPSITDSMGDDIPVEKKGPPKFNPIAEPLTRGTESVPVVPKAERMSRPPVSPSPSSTSIGDTTSEDSDTTPSEPIRIRRVSGRDATDLFSMDVRNADIRLFFGKLSELARVSILLSPNVTGEISLTLHEVRFETAIKAVLKSRGLVYEREGDIVIVGTTEEAIRVKQQNRQLVMKIFQPNYLSSAELNRLIEPLLSADGRHSVAAAAQTGLSRVEASHEGETVQRDAVIVQDVPDVLAQIDQVLVDLDIPPLQVSIEAKILSIRLSEGLQRGINFSLLPCRSNEGSSFAEGGIKHADLSCDIPTFVKSVERIADASVVSSQRIQVLNKHRAEMVIGDRVSFQSKTGEQLGTMEAGTRLIFRPSISADGSVRMEIHPERSYLTTNKRTKLPQQNMAELTTQVMVHDGATVAIGGLIAEQAVETTVRVPLVGSIPVVGAPFRHKHERLQRTELIILVTPHIVTDCDADADGKCLEATMEDRASQFRDRQSFAMRHNLARAHYERARGHFEQGNFIKARQQIEASLRQDKADHDALGLRSQIDQCLTQHAGR